MLPRDAPAQVPLGSYSIYGCRKLKKPRKHTTKQPKFLCSPPSPPRPPQKGIYFADGRYNTPNQGSASHSGKKPTNQVISEHPICQLTPRRLRAMLGPNLRLRPRPTVV
ncbi:hypothetical protein BV22DRAFT_826996 [Leucogyrophana mollusca]|uniref:Uncharacterized protein n=1 Tax=Leucogyrophana mollusca TaxID=85980 RepID=A0ACB8B3F9_9AGAM|nr:hypothetical protein BV22DRAFT_826996 [Leucogyrophana mollusca]